ncbi:hypothetical protein N9401_05860 [Amylibacter sp.]|mgnify:CR=1|nr:hypothetical protein [Amylibacter sp.]
MPDDYYFTEIVILLRLSINMDTMEGIWEFFNKDGSLEKTETYLEGKVLE